MGINESIIFLVIVGLSMSHGSLGQSSGCTTALISLAPCLTYISTSTGTSSSPPTTTPSSSCCSRLATVVQSRPQCLCSALNGGAAASLGVTINQTRALALPAACRLQTPPPTRCDGNYLILPNLFGFISKCNYLCIYISLLSKKIYILYILGMM